MDKETHEAQYIHLVMIEDPGHIGRILGLEVLPVEHRDQCRLEVLFGPNYAQHLPFKLTQAARSKVITPQLTGDQQQVEMR